MIGNQYIEDVTTIQLKSGSIQVLTPTQSTMDRLAWFFFHTDRQSLDVAIMIAKKNPIDLDKIHAWAESEGEIEKFEKFKAKL